MTLYRFRAMPLTPIHIGNGVTLAPEDYLIQKDMLIRFNRAAVLRDMPAAHRQQLEAALDNNEFAAAQEIVRGAVNLERHALSRISISDESHADLLTLVKNPDSPIRNREVHPFMFNPLDGKPYLPGSSIKGAIRTALINEYAGREKGRIKEFENLLYPRHLNKALEREERKRRRPLNTLEKLEIEAHTRTRVRSDCLEPVALRYFDPAQAERGRLSPALEKDPLRLLKVADAVLPPNSTRIDRALHWQHGKGATDIQMHYERLLCRGDDADSSFMVEIELDEAAIAHPAVRVGRKLDLGLIRTACNAFYSQRMHAEQVHFFSDDNLPEARYAAVGLVKFQPDKVLIAKSIQERGMLLRIGRFCQFESLSVDELREGWNIRKKEPIKDMGSSRTLCRSRTDVRGKSIALPFGWLLLTRED